MDIHQLRQLFHINKQPTTAIDQYVKNIVIIGDNPDISTNSVPEDIWEIGGLITAPTAATVATIVSNSASDTASNGIGARIILVEGLDSNYNPIFETVNLNGTSSVQTQQQFLRINHFRVVLSGTSQSNVGIITATVNGNIITGIGAGKGLAHTAFYTVAKGHSLYLTQVSMGIIRAASNITATIETIVYIPSLNTKVQAGHVVIGANHFVHTFHDITFPTIPENSDLRYMASYVSSNNTNAVTSIRGLLVNDAFITNIKGFTPTI